MWLQCDGDREATEWRRFEVRLGWAKVHPRATAATGACCTWGWWCSCGRSLERAVSNTRYEVDRHGVER